MFTPQLRRFTSTPEVDSRASIPPRRIQRCAAQPAVLWCQHHGGIWRSTDNAVSWQEVKAPLSSFGFAVAVHPREPDTAWFVPGVKDETRLPVAAARACRNSTAMT